MNILHVVNISFVIPYFLGEQLLYFKRKGYEEYIICSPSRDIDYFSQIYKFQYLSTEILRKISIIKDLKAVLETVRYIRNKQIDIVTGHTPKGALIAMLAAYITHVPIRIYFRHGLVYETSTGFKRKLLMLMDKLASALATKVICVSPSVYHKSIEDKLNSVSKQYLLSKGTCNGIDVEKFYRNTLNKVHIQKLRKDLNIEQTDLVIGYTGRLVRDKGIIELVHAFQKLQCKYPKLKLLLVGMLEERDALPNDIVETIRQNPNIMNTGYVQNSNIEYYYALMHVFVLPSYREGFPTSVLEASAMELPIVTTRATGCVDSIIEKETGIFVEHDSDSIATAIDYFCSDENRRIEFGKNGRKFVVDNFEQHIIWAEIEKVYK